MKKSLILVCFVLLLCGCYTHRDLWDTSNPMLHIESSWNTALNEPSMMEATALLYRNEDIIKQHHTRPNLISSRVTKGHYDVLLFNGVMDSEQDSNLDYVYFRGTDNLETFEVCVAEGKPSSRITRAEGEYIAHNDMQLFAYSFGEVDIEDDDKHYMRYQNGERTDLYEADDVGVRVYHTPKAVSYRFQVVMKNIVNPLSARYGAGALKGFVGSALLVTPHGRPQSGFPVTHHINLAPVSQNSLTRNADGEVAGILQSPVITTFGPDVPVELGTHPDSGAYFFEPVFTLTDGSEYRPEGGSIDVTQQVNEAIERIHAHHSPGGENISFDDNLFTIEIEERIALPIVDPGKVVDVEPWDPDEIVIVWIGRGGKTEND